MLKISRLARPRLAAAVALSLLLAGCLAPRPTATPTPRVPAGVATPRPDHEVRLTDHFVIYYTAEVPAAQVAAVAGYLEAAWRDIPPFLGLEPPSRLIRVYMGLDTPTSTGSPTGVIVITATSLADGYSAVPHEFTHVLTGFTGSQWIEEGLAMYMQERFPAGRYSFPSAVSVDSWSMALLQAGKWIPLTEIPPGQPDRTSSADMAPLMQAYLESGSFVKYLIETYGLAPFWEMHGDLNGWYAAEKAYGKPIEDLSEEWRQHLASSTIPPEDCPECLAGFLEWTDLSIQLEQQQHRLTADEREQLGREFGATYEAFCRKDAQAMQGHLEAARRLLQVSSDDW